MSSNEMSPEDQKLIRSLPGNNRCADCGQSYPEWASISFGTIFCIDCSGRHRGLGTHISFVRSIGMDSWTNDQIKVMKSGGNQQCLDYLSDRGIGSNISIRERYDNEIANEYKIQLKTKLAGKPNKIDKPRKKRPRNKPSSEKQLFDGVATSTMKLSATEEAHTITSSLLRTKHLMEQNLERTHEASNVLQSDEHALREAREGQMDLGGTVKGAVGALRALKHQDIQERIYLMCAIGFYCCVVMYVIWTRIRIPFLSG